MGKIKYNNKSSQSYKKIERTDKKDFKIQTRNIKRTINARKIKGYDNVYVSDDVIIKPKALHEINKYNNGLVKQYGIKVAPDILIVASEELNYNVNGIYLADRNAVIYPSDVSKETQRHEMWHCKQADDYKAKYGEITRKNYFDYITSASLEAKRRLKKKELTLEKIKIYGEYFERMYSAERYDEIEAQFKAMEE